MCGRPPRGNVLVELAFLLPMLLLLGVGTFEFGRGFLTHFVVVHAARDGARAAMDAAADDNKIIQTVTKAAAPLVLTSITVTRPAGEVQVKATYTFSATEFISDLLWGGGDLTLTHIAVSRPG